MRSSLVRGAALVGVAAGLLALPAVSDAVEAGVCDAEPHAGGEWSTYGGDLTNSRRQSSETTIGVATSQALEPAFVHQTPGPINNTPIVDGGCVFVASQGSNASTAHVAALDAADGTPIWSVDLHVGTSAFGGPQVGSPALFEDLVIAPVNRKAGPYLVALDRYSGAERWRATIDDQPSSGVNASVVVHDGMAFIGFFGAAGPWEPERGGFALYDARTGELLEKTFAIPDADFAQGYAGAGIWGTPAIDTATGFAYVGTSNPHHPQLEHDRSNAILKIDLDRESPQFGQIVAHYKGVHDTIVPGAQDQPVCETKPDVYYTGNFSATCLAVDVDFGASPNLFTADGETRVGALQKAGVYHILRTADMEPAARVPVNAPCFACNAASSAFADGRAFVAAGPPGQLIAVDGSAGIPAWASLIGGGLTYNAVSVANDMVWTVDSLGFLNGYEQSTGVQLVKRPIRDDTGVSMIEAATSSGIAIAHNTLYTAASTFVVAYRAA